MRASAAALPLPAVLLAAAAVTTTGCGAKTGLDAPERAFDAGFDARPDASPEADAPVIRRPARCQPLRIRTRVGVVVSMTPDADARATSGYEWTLARMPEGSRAVLVSDGSDTATMTPDRAGEYQVLVTIRMPVGDGPDLMCPITVIADPPDPRCPGYAIAEPRVVAIPGGSSQVAFDVVWDVPRTTEGGGVGAVLDDDPNARVSAVVIERAVRAAGATPAEILSAEGGNAERELREEFSAVGVFVGRTSTTHEGLPLRRTTLRIGTGSATDPATLRDRALRRLTQLAPPAAPGPAQAPAASFYIEVATMLRADARRVITVVTFAPSAVFDDTASPASIRVNDLANGTAIARTSSVADVRCHAVVSTRTLRADFLWLVDTSGSMEDDQARLGDTATQFFREMNNAGIDFRVGVMQAGHVTPRLSGGTGGNGPFRWISGSAANGAQQMAFQVTEERYMSENPNLRPWRVTGDDEEPLAAAVVAVEEFERQATLPGMVDPNFTLRRDAAKVVFLVTDEPGTNDVGRFFNATEMNRTRWGTTAADLTRNISTFFTSRGITPFGLVDFSARATCPDVLNIAGCVITASGGAFIPIDTSNDREAAAALSAAMTRIVDSIAGSASEFVLPVVPISGSLRVRLESRFVPRSRSQGFDYEDRSRALVFHGPSFRPAVGQQVRTAYFFWRAP